MLSEIEREKKIAEHLFYVSLKYTKTTDVILNLLNRWVAMINISIDYLLKKAKKNKKIKSLSDAPKAKEMAIRAVYSKEKVIIEIMDMYSFFRKLPDLDKVREYEFRKNVALRVISGGKEVRIDMEKLKAWNEKVNEYISFVNKMK
jgi:hypothetical protein